MQLPPGPSPQLPVSHLQLCPPPAPGSLAHPLLGTLLGSVPSHSGLSLNIGTCCVLTSFEWNIYICFYLPKETLEDSLKTKSGDYWDGEPGR